MARPIIPSSPTDFFSISAALYRNVINSATNSSGGGKWGNMYFNIYSNMSFVLIYC